MFRTLDFSRRFSSSDNLFGKILIANRGEIACRVIKTCKRLGIRTVAVYSEADGRSKHVRLADEAVCIGPAASKLSYLNMDAIVAACETTGAEAVHPGYGFLSENNHFASKLDSRKIAFIGPPASAIDAMGDKINSKKIAKRAGVNTIPGFLGEVATPQDVLRISNEIGYPVMIKASAGGGGKGMRIAFNDKEALDGFRLSKEEAAASFGDDRMLIEKFVEQPRHIEIQVIGDKLGNTLYLPERECSIQRRNQKVLEEAPSPFLDPATRKAMGEQAVMLAKAVGYYSAGTVEMLVDAKKNFYFLEMNTRLQVEHPVTEMITGLDLVEEMIRCAAGKSLSRTTQDQVGINGWAMEARVYAEDPARNFLPSIGTLKTYVEPVGPGIRCDSGITEGAEISVHYDPMICKLITHGKNREESIDILRAALDQYVIQGVTHNIPFLRDVMDHKRYKDGRIDTKFIEVEYPGGFKGHVLTEVEAQEISKAAAVVEFLREENRYSAFSSGSVHESPLSDTYDVSVVDSGLPAAVVKVSRCSRTGNLLVNDKPSNAKWLIDSVFYQDGDVTLQVLERHVTGGSVIQMAGTRYELDVKRSAVKDLFVHMPVISKPDLSKMLVSPMPGTVIQVAVKPGDKVVIGQEIVVVEAMKMRNLLRSPVDGIVKEIRCKAGKSVKVEEILVEFE
ncbi:mitochondrial propionyl-CoA carboxylase alpha subunit [Andalucia godoyi]|uniref:Mitochondrial propionyl-CoA carboxylase alpha subunit n=1 Tax=Andalucia godoyi TaxID=505711 RepID=A0A8K0F4M9_ANDGO|nr:mitochondrial propionyl-CoA carboxylase alpha subunit [Andalucia godoyi]|eukprot:ANDGO_05260.mRNA.1 mitochondrial propionyl-CoA carboxylase alpha subunit